MIIIIGVSGSGKSTIGQALASRLDCPFCDGDDYHPPENVAKMASGIPLNDDDRAPWLARLATLIEGHLGKGETAVLACSALKKSYRDQLTPGADAVLFVYLHGSFDLIWDRMQARKNHYMQSEMLQSQFDSLEAPDAHEAITIDAAEPVEKIVSAILAINR